MDPTNFSLEMELNGAPATLLFDFDTLMAFEKRAKKPYMNWLASLWRGSFTAAAREANKATEMGMPLDEVDVPIDGMMTMSDFCIILWAAHHTPATDILDARWHMRFEEIVRLVRADPFGTYLSMAPGILQAILQNINVPKKKQTEENAEPRPTNTSPTPIRPSGGAASGPSESDVLDSLEPR